LKPLRRSTCPFTTVPDIHKPSRFRPDPPKAKAVWVEPEVVAEISYREMTRDGNVRHPAFKGLREDKTPKEVVLEAPVAPPMERKTKNGATKKAAPRTQLVKPTERSERSSLLNPTESTQEKEVNGHPLVFTNLAKVYWPEEGYTKRDMLNYYYQMAPLMLPYYKDKPQTLNRYPNGILGKTFYQKDVKGKVPTWVQTFPYFSEADQRAKEFIVVSDEASLLYIASLGCIEINPWNSRTAAPDNPDWCVIDLDPDRNTFDQVVEAAQVTRRILDELGVSCYPKTSGSTGLHIYIPLKAKYPYAASREFARLIATLVHRELPKYTSIERLIAQRKGRMYIDFLQNRPQATVAGPYSLRPKPGAPVSMPLDWSEVKKGLRITDHTIRNAVARVREVGDLFKPVMGKGIDLSKAVRTAHRVFDDLPSGLGRP
jgi:bifunctional non-homologous end joining protein LigD